MQINQRLQSLDVFRGITVAAMILVNNPGSWENVYSPLLHAHWNGCTPTDLVFPFFLFSVGMSIHLAYKNKVSLGLTRPLLYKILKRTIIIFSLGLFLSLFPEFDFSNVRIPGVLQRISLVFGVCAILYLTTSWLTQIRVLLATLIAYYLLMTLIPVPGVGASNLDPGTNLAAWLDNLLLSGHMWSQTKTWDPEGILSTLPAIGSGLAGMLAGRLVTSFDDAAKRVSWLFFTGAILTVCGLAWGLAFPINKSLWTSSYVLYTSGIAMQVLATLYWTIDVLGYEKWSRPFTWYGVNALAVFVGSGLLAESLIKIDIQQGSETLSVWSFIYTNLFTTWLSPVNASLGFALMWVVFFGAILYVLFKKQIFIKV